MSTSLSVPPSQKANQEEILAMITEILYTLQPVFRRTHNVFDREACPVAQVHEELNRQLKNANKRTLSYEYIRKLFDSIIEIDDLPIRIWVVQATEISPACERDAHPLIAENAMITSIELSEALKQRFGRKLSEVTCQQLLLHLRGPIGRRPPRS